MEKKIFSTNSAGAVGYPHSKKNLVYTSHHLNEKLTWNRSKHKR